MSVCSRSVYFTLAVCGLFNAQAQPGISSKGTDHWLGFLRNNDGVLRLTLFLSADQDASGTVSLPLQGWSQDFTIAADAVTLVELPVEAMHTSSEVVENKGVHVTSDVPISVFAESYQHATEEASLIYPLPSLGTEYRVMAYAGFPELDPYASELLIVATENATEVEITPTAATLGGHPAGLPFLVQLEQGASYQLCAATAAGDLTGTLVRTTEQSGPCRRIAVFGGSICPMLPVSCPGCDHIFEQQLAVPFWGTSYFSLPWAGSNGYTYRVLAHVDNTTAMIDGVEHGLNAGQFYEVNGTNVPHCFSSDQPVSVGQYMEGAECGGNGDPSFVMLNAVGHEAMDVRFQTMGDVTTPDHYINVVVSTTGVGNVILDGSSVASSAFTPFPACMERSYAQLPIDSGAHRITCADGLLGVVYGTGMGFQSYAFSLGAFATVVDPCALSQPETAGASFTLSPNPATQHFTLGGLPRSTYSSIVLVNAQGTQVRRWAGILPEGAYIGDLPAGLYTVEVRAQNGASGYLKLIIE